MEGVAHGLPRASLVVANADFIAVGAHNSAKATVHRPHRSPQSRTFVSHGDRELSGDAAVLGVEVLQLAPGGLREGKGHEEGQ
jgi:hypothetical protein